MVIRAEVITLCDTVKPDIILALVAESKLDKSTKHLEIILVILDMIIASTAEE